MNDRKPNGDNRPKRMDTVPPSTPQGPESNDQLVDPAYRDGPYPGDLPDQTPGEGSAVAAHVKDPLTEGPDAIREGEERGPGSVLDKAGRDPLKKHGREKNEP